MFTNNYKIGIIGHGPETFHNNVDNAISNALDLLFNQYKDNLIFNIGSNIGVEHYSIKMCIKNHYKYHLYLPTSQDITSRHWYQSQQDDLKEYFNKSNAVTIISNNLSQSSVMDSYKQLVDHSNFIVCFWVGKKQGKVADVIKYALKTNKLVLNGLDDMRLVTNNNFSKNRITQGKRSV